MSDNKISENESDNNPEQPIENDFSLVQDGVNILFTAHNKKIGVGLVIKNAPDSAQLLSAIMQDLHGSVLGLELVKYIAGHYIAVPKDRHIIDEAMTIYQKFIEEYEEAEEYEDTEKPWPNGPLVWPSHVFKE